MSEAAASTPMSAAPPPTSAEHRLAEVTAWEPQRPAERIAAGILMARGNSNCYLISGAEGDLAINVGTAYQGARNRERFEQLLGRPLTVRAIVLCQSHADHFGGWEAFAEAGTEIYAQERFPELLAERKALRDFFIPRTSAIIGRKIGWSDPVRMAAYWEPSDPPLTKLFARECRFELSGRRYELRCTSGGESLDGLIVWMPDERIVFTGNLLGAMFTQFPHLATIRGDRQRSVRDYLKDVEALIALQPELLVTGHEDPIAGAETIRAELTRLRDAVAHLRSYTIAGMAAGKTLWTLMAEAELPDELELRYSRGPLSWYVRSIWEELTGWFRDESATELFAVPPSSVWPRLAELAGGAAALAAEGARQLAAGRPEQALHFTDIALAAEPRGVEAQRVCLEALRLLLRRAGGRAFDEVAYLETAIIDAERGVQEQ